MPLPKTSSTHSWSAKLQRAVDRRFDQLVSLRRHLHMHPEPSGQEDETSLHLYRLLDEEGFAVQMGPEGCGVICQPKEPPEAPRIGMRGDIDALRIHDAKQVEYRSRNEGIMHACGHDAHAASVFGAVLALSDMARDGQLPWPVNWRGVFQPAEETSEGAIRMIEAGALEDVQAMLAVHMDPSRKVGRIGVREGPLTASCDEMRLVVRGRGGHAARPHESVDPITAAAQLISTIYLFVPRATDSRDAIVVTIGQIQGGHNSNVIPEQVFLGGTLRTLDAVIRRRTIEHIRQLTRGIAETSGCQIELDVRPGPSAVYNHAQMTSLVRRTGAELLSPESVEEIDHPSMGGEDFAHYLERVPGSMYRVGCASEETGNSPLHSPNFDIDEQAISVAAKTLAHTAVLWSQPQESA